MMTLYFVGMFRLMVHEFVKVIELYGNFSMKLDN